METEVIMNIVCTGRGLVISYSSCSILANQDVIRVHNKIYIGSLHVGWLVLILELIFSQTDSSTMEKLRWFQLVPSNAGVEEMAVFVPQLSHVSVENQFMRLAKFELQK